MWQVYLFIWLKCLFFLVLCCVFMFSVITKKFLHTIRSYWQVCGYAINWANQRSFSWWRSEDICIYTCIYDILWNKWVPYWIIQGHDLWRWHWFLLRLILHLFLSLPPVNLAWECGALSRWWGVFPPKSKTVYKAPFADQHTELHITSPHPTLPCFSLWELQSLSFPFVELFSQPIEAATTIKPNPCVIFSPSWKARKHISRGLLSGPWQEQLRISWELE